jgi:hypothetical protein
VEEVRPDGRDRVKALRLTVGQRQSVDFSSLSSSRVSKIIVVVVVGVAKG